MGTALVAIEVSHPSKSAERKQPPGSHLICGTRRAVETHDQGSTVATKGGTTLWLLLIKGTYYYVWQYFGSVSRRKEPRASG